jgi:hypothetical protein
VATDPELRLHQEWIGLVQPVGVVVSPIALHRAQAFLPKNVVAEQDALVALLGDSGRAPVALSPLCTGVLGWDPERLVDTHDDPSLELVLPEYGETLRPEHGVREPVGGGWLLLVDLVPPETDFDAPEAHDERWRASPQSRLERLLRDKGVPIGLLYDGTKLRLVFAPRGETWATSRSRCGRWSTSPGGRCSVRCSCCSGTRGCSRCRRSSGFGRCSRRAGSTRTR